MTENSSTKNETLHDRFSSVNKIIKRIKAEQKKDRAERKIGRKTKKKAGTTWWNNSWWEEGENHAYW